jgi:DNA-directed RNA polymerase specialized sigma24 family protein
MLGSVEMRFFGGMTAEEAGAVLGLSARTIKSDWRKARAFLSFRLASEGWTPKAESHPASYAAD